LAGVFNTSAALFSALLGLIASLRSRRNAARRAREW
jgi:hypothetical protein